MGAPLILFKDGPKTDKIVEITVIQIRALEIQQLLHLLQPSALLSVEHHQIIQKDTQNKQHTIDETILEFIHYLFIDEFI